MGILDMLFRPNARRKPAAVEPAPLTAAQVAQWEAEGYLILRDFISQDEIARVRGVLDDEWAHTGDNAHVVDVLTGPHAGQAFKMAQVPEGVREEAYKLNNLFARRPEIRSVALAPRLRKVYEQLLGGEPLICNSLNFERGSQQPFHIDTWYMPPPVDNMMVVASIALDDVDADNGPMVYYPASHLIPPYRFSDGRLNEIQGEAAQCRAYLEREIAERGLKEVEMRGKSGDVLLWHAQLLHGGRPIRDMKKTRSSLVVHYWRACDLPKESVRVDPVNGSYLGRTLRGEIQF